MKENHNITTCDWLALETPLGSQPIMHAQKSPWKLDVEHWITWMKDKLYIDCELTRLTETWLELLLETTMSWNSILSYTQNLQLHYLWYLVSLVFGIM